MQPTTRQQLLHTLCQLLPPADAERIGAMDPDDSVTYAEAYCACRPLPQFTPEMRSALLEVTFSLMDEETQQVCEQRSPAAEPGAGAPGNVTPLRRRTQDA